MKPVKYALGSLENISPAIIMGGGKRKKVLTVWFLVVLVHVCISLVHFAAFFLLFK